MDKLTKDLGGPVAVVIGGDESCDPHKFDFVGWWRFSVQAVAKAKRLRRFHWWKVLPGKLNNSGTGLTITSWHSLAQKGDLSDEEFGEALTLGMVMLLTDLRIEVDFHPQGTGHEPDRSQWL